MVSHASTLGSEAQISVCSTPTEQWRGWSVAMGTTAVQAHRGSPDAASGVRENTLEAFLRARELGADGVEMDVRMTADGGLAVHHNPEVEGVGLIRELTTADLPAFVPLLAEILEVLDGLTINIEIKNLPNEPGFDPSDRLAAEVADLVEGSGRESEVVVSSFWPGALEAVRTASAEIATGLLFPPGFATADAVAAATSRGCTALHLHVDQVEELLVDQAHQAGLAVAAWTVNKADDLAALAALGVDTVITDEVSLALRVIRHS
jgi:glycerophosphoryl diester phosphodiesterase